MRFSLRHLFLLFLAWAVSSLVSRSLDFRVEKTYWSFDAAYAEICEIRSFVISERNSHPEMSILELQQDLESGLHGFCDPWGNPYQIVEIDGLDSIDTASNVHLYSLSLDGQSTSRGNDDDDINSWDYDRRDYYGRFDDVRDHQKQIIATLILAPQVLIVLVLIDNRFCKPSG